MPIGSRPNPPSRTVMVVFTGHIDAAVWSNVMWLALTGDGEITHATLITLADALFGQYTSHFKDPLCNRWSLEAVQVVLWQDGEEFSAFSSHITVQGSNAGAMAPAQVAACISWPIAQHYRGGHPRTYLAGVPMSALSNNQLFDGTWTADLSGRAQAFHTGVEALGPYGGIATVEHGIVSFVHNKEWRTPPVFRRIQGDAFVDRRIDTQRRRLGRDLP